MSNPSCGSALASRLRQEESVTFDKVCLDIVSGPTLETVDASNGTNSIEHPPSLITTITTTTTLTHTLTQHTHTHTHIHSLTHSLTHSFTH